MPRLRTPPRHLPLSATREDRLRKRRSRRQRKGAEEFSSPAPPAAGGGGGAPVEEERGEGGIYSHPELYDAAFGYRDFRSETEFLLRCHAEHGGGEGPVRVLELAAGPARHALTAIMVGDVDHDSDDGSDDDGERDWKAPPSVSGSVAVDISPEMSAHCASTVVPDILPMGPEYGFERRFRYIVDDVRDLTALREEEAASGAEARFDAAWMLLGGSAHLPTNADFVRCLTSLRSVLSPPSPSSSPTVVLEMSHPRETFRLVDCSEEAWEVPLPGSGERTLRVTWGGEDDPFDPVSQVWEKTVTLDVLGPEKGSTPLQRVREVVPMRQHTYQEVEMLSKAAGFEVAATYGAMDRDVPIDDDEAFRMVCVLRMLADAPAAKIY